VRKDGEAHRAREADFERLLRQEAARARLELSLRRCAQQLALVPIGQAAREQVLSERSLRGRAAARVQVQPARQVRRLLQQHRVRGGTEQHGVYQHAELLRCEDRVHRGKVLSRRVSRSVQH
jgi:hypothetical protein